MLEIHETPNGMFLADICLEDSSWKEAIVYNGGEWDKWLTPVIREYGGDGVAIDIGANIGILTLLMSRHYRKVYAIEPQNWVYYLLCANLALNYVNNVIPVNVAAYDCEEILYAATDAGYTNVEFDNNGNIDYTRKGQYSSIVFTPDNSIPHGNYRGINSARIDHIVPINEKVSLIKCDAQGSDLRALMGCEAIIRKWSPTIIFEYEEASVSHHGDSLSDYMSYLSSFGCYKLRTYVDKDGNILNYVAEKASLEEIKKYTQSTSEPVSVV